MSTAETLSQPATHGLFIDGAEAPGSSGETLDVLNPATGEVIARTAHGTAQDVDAAIRSARRAFEGKEWGGMDVPRPRPAGQQARRRARGAAARALPARDRQQRPPGERDARADQPPRRTSSATTPDSRSSRRDAVVPVEGRYLNYTLRTPIGVVGQLHARSTIR